MPLYEYQCKSCHALTERIQKFSDPHLTLCPHCGGDLEQVLSAPAVQFKGAGWYVTDYAKKSGTAASGGNGAAPAPKSDSAPAPEKAAATKTESPKTETSSPKNEKK